MQDSASKATPLPRGRSFVLRFISGKYQGGEFPVVADKEIIVGRSSELDMVLVEDMVSRKHAKIQLQADGIWIEDLASTNGTFVNGEKIKRAKLKEGDRVLIGTSILKVIASDGVAAAPANEPLAPKPEAEVPSERTGFHQAPLPPGPGQTRTMAGSIEEIPLPDLLQLFGTSKKTGVLTVRSDSDVGRIYLRKGTIYFAQINDLADVPPMKSTFRLLTWAKGFFEFDTGDVPGFEGQEIDLGVQELLMEGLRQLDEFAVLKDKLPEMHAKLVIPSPLVPHLHDLTPKELDAFQLVLNWGHLETVLNKSTTTDLDTGEALVKLLKGGWIVRE